MRPNSYLYFYIDDNIAASVNIYIYIYMAEQGLS